MASKLTIALISVLILGCAAQRSPYAGKRPIGYPQLETTSTTTTTSQDGLGNRFGDDNVTSQTLRGQSTERLPIEALGDRDLVNKISKLPVDQQPFWYINWKVLEEHRGNPQTYPHKTNSFIGRN